MSLNVALGGLYSFNGYFFVNPYSSCTSLTGLSPSYNVRYQNVLGQRYPVDVQGASNTSFSKPQAKWTYALYADEGVNAATGFQQIEGRVNDLLSVLDTAQVGTLTVTRANGEWALCTARIIDYPLNFTSDMGPFQAVIDLTFQLETDFE